MSSSARLSTIIGAFLALAFFSGCPGQPTIDNAPSQDREEFLQRVSYTCRCGCEVVVTTGPGVGTGVWNRDFPLIDDIRYCAPLGTAQTFKVTSHELEKFLSDGNTCTPGNSSTICKAIRKDCRTRVCPAVEHGLDEIARDQAPGAFNVCKPLPECHLLGQQSDDGDNYDFDQSSDPVVTNITNEAECDRKCEGDVCGPIQFTVNGGIEVDPTSIKDCSIIERECTGDRSPKVCLDPGGDPPVLKGGVRRAFYEPRTIGRVEKGNSNIKVTVTKKNKTITRTVSTTGRIVVSRQICLQGTCKVGIALQLYQEEPIKIKGIRVRNVTLSGGTGRSPVQMSNGKATIPKGEMQVTATGIVEEVKSGDEKSTGFREKNQSPIDLKLTSSGNRFVLSDGFKVSNDPDIVVEPTVRGEIVAQPPTPDAGNSKTVECTESAGETVTLDATSSSDPDGDLSSFTWWKGKPKKGTRIGTKAKIDAFTPLGNHFYSVAVRDSRLQHAFDGTSIEVRDTIAPTISQDGRVRGVCVDDLPTDDSNNLIVLRAKRAFGQRVDDACDTDPTVAIESVRRKPLDDDLDDASPPTFFDDRICVSTEIEDQALLVDFHATDGSGNRSRTAQQVLVPLECDDLGDRDQDATMSSSVDTGIASGDDDSSDDDSSDDGDDDSSNNDGDDDGDDDESSDDGVDAGNTKDAGDTPNGDDTVDDSKLERLARKNPIVPREFAAPGDPVCSGGQRASTFADAGSSTGTGSGGCSTSDRSTPTGFFAWFALLIATAAFKLRRKNSTADE